MTPSLSEFTPIVREDRGESVYVEVMLELDKCGACARPMFRGDAAGWPLRWRDTMDAQVKRAGWAFASRVFDKDHRRICVDCRLNDKATILCALCKQERSSSEAHESFGDPPDYLCEVCYQTVPAAMWDAAHKQLEEIHRYDFD